MPLCLGKGTSVDIVTILTTCSDLSFDRQDTGLFCLGMVVSNCCNILSNFFFLLN